MNNKVRVIYISCGGGWQVASGRWILEVEGLWDQNLRELGLASGGGLFPVEVIIFYIENKLNIIKIIRIMEIIFSVMEPVFIMPLIRFLLNG